MYRTGSGSIGFTSNTTLKLKVHDKGVESLDQFLAADGATNTPGYAFTNDENMGIARINSQLCLVNDNKVQLAMTPTVADFNVTIRNIHGSKETPSYTFDDDTDTGIYRQGEGAVSVSGASKEVVRFTNSRNYSFVPMQFENGSASAPSIRFNDTTNTGIYQPADKEIAFSSNNKEVVRINESGMINKKAFFADGTATNPAYAFTVNGDSGFYAPDANRVAMSVNGVNKETYTTTEAFSKLLYRLPRGSKAETAYSFEGDTNTGMYSPGENKLALAIAGVDILSLDGSFVRSSKNFLAPDGSISATAPNSRASYAFADDANTGVFSPSNGQVGFMADGVEKYRVQSDAVIANVPHRDANGNNSHPQYSFSGAPSTGMYANGVKLAFASEGVNVLTLTKDSAQVHKTLHLGTQSVIWKSGANLAAIVPESNASKMAIAVPSEFRVKVGTGTPFYVTRSAIKVPTGTSPTADTPSNGMIRYNSSLDKFQGYYENKWQEIGGGGRVTEDGNASTPGLYWEKETNTGLFRPGDGVLAVTTSGGERARFTATQTVIKSKIRVESGAQHGTIDCTSGAQVKFTTSHKAVFNHDVEARSFMNSHQSGVKADGLLYQGGVAIQDICLQTVRGKGTVPMDTMLKNPAYNGCYQREVDPSVPGYNFGSLVNLGNDQARFQMWAPHGQIGNGTTGGGSPGAESSLWIRTGWGNDIKPWRRVMCHGDTAGDATTIGGVSKDQFLRSDQPDTMNGRLVINYGSNTMNNTDVSKAWLLAGSNTMGVGIDNNEVVQKGDHLYLTAVDNHIKMRAGGQEVAVLSKDLGTFTKRMQFNMAATINGKIHAKDGINISEGKTLYFAGDTDSATIGFKNVNDQDTDSYMYFETSDNDNEYFKFRHRGAASTGSPINDWAVIRKTGIQTTGDTNQLGLYRFGGRDFRYNDLRMMVAYTGKPGESYKKLVINYSNDFDSGVEIQGTTLLARGQCTREATYKHDLVNKEYVDGKIAASGGGDAAAGKTLNFTSDSGTAWTNQEFMAGKTRVGGWSGTAGAAKNYISIKNEKGETDLFVDGDIYVKTRVSGRSQTHDKVLVAHDTTAADVGALAFSNHNASESYPGSGLHIGKLSYNNHHFIDANDTLYINENAGKRVAIGTTTNLAGMDSIPFEIKHKDTSAIMFTTPTGQGVLNYNFDQGYKFMHNGPNVIVDIKPNGELVAAGNIVAYSDKRLKTNIKPIENALDKVAKIRGVTYDRTDIVTDRQVGVIAQEVEKVLPEAVSTNDEGMKAVAYGNMNALLIEAVKEEKQKREALEAEVAELKELVKKLLSK